MTRHGATARVSSTTRASICYSPGPEPLRWAYAGLSTPNAPKTELCIWAAWLEGALVSPVTGSGCPRADAGASIGVAGRRPKTLELSWAAWLEGARCSDCGRPPSEPVGGAWGSLRGVGVCGARCTLLAVGGRSSKAVDGRRPLGGVCATVGIPGMLEVWWCSAGRAGSGAGGLTKAGCSGRAFRSCAMTIVSRNAWRR